MLFDLDAVIVGAGPAGCAAAFDLAAAGRRVLLLDKRSFPRHKACACGLTRKTLKALRYPVDPVIERRCHDVILQEAGPAFATGSRTAEKSQEVRARTRAPFCAMAVRERFDAFCLHQTLARGAGFLRIDSLIALRELPTHVELDVLLPDGARRTLTAPALIGADGSNGQTRRLAAGLTDKPGAPSSPTAVSSAKVGGEPQTPRQATTASLPAEPVWFARGFALEATVRFDDLPPRLPAGDQPLDLVFDFSPIAGGYGWLFPKGDHVNIGVGGFVPQSAMDPGAPSSAAASSSPEVGMDPGAPSSAAASTSPEVGMDPGAPSSAAVSTSPEVGSSETSNPTTSYETVTRNLLASYTRAKLGVDLAALPKAHVTGQHLGLGGHAYTPAGRVLLTGDAAGLVDPLTGEGIHSAIVSGQAAAAAILQTFAPDQLSSEPATNLGAPGPDPRTRASTATSLGAPGPDPRTRASASEAAALAAAYARHLQPLQETLAFSHRAARSFYREPGRGMRAMRNPILRPLILKTYADGLPQTELIARLAKAVI